MKKFIKSNNEPNMALLRSTGKGAELQREFPNAKNLSEAVYLKLNNLRSAPSCIICGKPARYTTFSKGYASTCSKKCTCIEKYGVEHVMQSSEFKEKTKITCLEKYGVDYITQSKLFRRKTKKTNLKKYGYETPAENPIIRKKMKSSNQKKYGVDFSAQSQIIKDKKNATNLKKYGNIVPFLSSEHKMQRLYQTYNRIMERTAGRVVPLFEQSEFISVEAELLWECIECKNAFMSNVDDGKIPRCPKCFPPLSGTSKAEKEIAEFIKSLGFEITQNVRNIISPKEIDIYIPKKKIAIEYHGLYWHSNQYKSNNYHLEKYKACLDKNIRLIQIFEDEWENQKDICQNRLRHILGINKTICYGRQTIIREITIDEYKDFLLDHHIQGYVNTNIKLGAFYNDNLVAVMGFGKNRRALGQKVINSEDFELLRFATVGNIPGIGSKMFKYFIINFSPKKIISYCDVRWGNGLFYEKLGMSLEKLTTPNYWYCIDGKRKHRFNYTKHKLIEQGYPKNKTEKEIMADLNYNWIYDCGNKKYTITFP